MSFAPRIKTRGIRAVAVMSLGTAFLACSPSAAATVDYDITFGVHASTFQAPAGGGTVTGLSVTLGGVTFDTPDPIMPPLYDPVANDISAAGSLFGYFLNSIAAPGCPVNNCVLELETAIDALTPPAYAAFNKVIFGGIISSGFYEITPSETIGEVVPLPAALPLLAAALGGLGLVSRRKKKAT